MKTRNKRLSLLLAVLVMLLSVSVISCNSKKEQKGPQPTEFEMGMTNQDSIAVRGLIDQFFSFVKAKDYAAATQMLYRVPQIKLQQSCDDSKAEPKQIGESKAGPQPLSNNEIEKVIKMLKAIPMVDYKIEYIKFNESYNNEVLCYVVIKKSDSKDMPDITTKMFFKPMNHLGQRCLGLMNSGSGDQGVVDPAKRDSVKEVYAKEQKEAKATKK